MTEDIQILKRVNVNNNLIIKHKIVKLLEENLGENLWVIDLGKMFLDVNQMHNPPRPPPKKKINKVNFIKIKQFFFLQNILLKGQTACWGEKCGSNISDKGLVPKTYEKHSKLNNEKK